MFYPCEYPRCLRPLQCSSSLTSRVDILSSLFLPLAILSQWRVTYCYGRPFSSLPLLGAQLTMWHPYLNLRCPLVLKYLFAQIATSTKR